MSRNRTYSFIVLIAILVAAAGGLWLYRSLHAHAGGQAGGKAAGSGADAASSTAGPQGGGGARGPGPGGAGGTVTVAVDTARLADVPVYLTALGTVAANYTVTVTSRVDGQLQQVFFTEGQRVKKGQLLAQIDPRAYQATLAQYQGALAQNQAQLNGARLTLERYRRLYEKDSLAKQDLDTQTATVGQYEGAVQSDWAQIASARLNVDYTRIVSPIDGYVGLRLTDPGNMVHASDTTGIVTVTQTDPIAVTFSVPQANIDVLVPRVRQGQALPAEALDQLSGAALATGSLKYISNEIDTSTGTIKLKALFANPNEKLFPNQSVNVKLRTDVLHDAVVVPSAAVQLGSDGSFVYVVGADDKVVRRAVTVGPTLGDRSAISAGVKNGERVVTRGIDHLRDGSKVQVEKAATANAASGAQADSASAGKAATDSTGGTSGTSGGLR
ncbi:MdtA/MuxA family multidrug efflux RND transporter periplasmic adaptor subunit [Chitinasiproducens palmae]|uniref:Membrane fusion protein, multidrug efflux system n=1 Tax=Chitinasiproducens palmae TaxID=1770053 RepID=A0A1H2PLN0_9BURK|nr:MdtA/MuxA family multidrug efflux RND transporter periplasmic adaptor subunit [Chitinasiproducens palmae]SDV47317.1 membrane fusion protein, multidrug efflux system [Chitinasiproducens palmae]